MVFIVVVVVVVVVLAVVMVVGMVGSGAVVVAGMLVPVLVVKLLNICVKRLGLLDTMEVEKNDLLLLVVSLGAPVVLLLLLVPSNS